MPSFFSSLRDASSADVDLYYQPLGSSFSIFLSLNNSVSAYKLEVTFSYYSFILLSFFSYFYLISCSSCFFFSCFFLISSKNVIYLDLNTFYNFYNCSFSSFILLSNSSKSNFYSSVNCSLEYFPLTTTNSYIYCKSLNFNFFPLYFMI